MCSETPICLHSCGTDPRPTLRRADLIPVVDHMTRHEALVFGRAALARITKGRTARRLRVVRIGTDLETEGLEKVEPSSMLYVFAL